uniref:hypothetical protein n=1 Tax=Photorhabdus luminescens TaxID=29488 RepID=UPI001C403419
KFGFLFIGNEYFHDGYHEPHLGENQAVSMSTGIKQILLFLYPDDINSDYDIKLHSCHLGSFTSFQIDSSHIDMSKFSRWKCSVCLNVFWLFQVNLRNHQLHLN